MVILHSNNSVAVLFIYNGKVWLFCNSLDNVPVLSLTGDSLQVKSFYTNIFHTTSEYVIDSLFILYLVYGYLDRFL